MTFRLPDALATPDTDQAVSYLRRYYSRRVGINGMESPGTYTGEFFDRLGDDPSPDAFTAEDLFAVSCLSVPIAAPTAVKLVKPGPVCDGLSQLLSAIPIDTCLWELESISPDWAALQLERALKGLDSIGEVRATKLIARKRPLLYPVVDSVVRQVTGTQRSLFTVPFWEKLREDDGALVEHLRRIRSEAGLPEQISLLRVFDVVAWMEGTAGVREGVVSLDIERGD